jgi:hypothetical protein
MVSELNSARPLSSFEVPLAKISRRESDIPSPFAKISI